MKSAIVFSVLAWAGQHIQFTRNKGNTVPFATALAYPVRIQFTGSIPTVLDRREMRELGRGALSGFYKE